MPTPKSAVEVQIRNPAQLGAALGRFRKLDNLSQGAVARNAGAFQAKISNVELGAPGTRVDIIFKILAALDLEMVIRKRTKG